MSYATCKRGTDLPQAKVDDVIVREIRRMHERKKLLISAINARYSLEAMGARFGLKKTTVAKIATYETWRHVL